MLVGATSGGFADLAAAGEDEDPLLERLRVFHEAATARVTALHEQLVVAEDVAADLAERLHRTG